MKKSKRERDEREIKDAIEQLKWRWVQIAKISVEMNDIEKQIHGIIKRLEGVE